MRVRPDFNYTSAGFAGFEARHNVSGQSQKRNIVIHRRTALLGTELAVKHFRGVAAAH